MHRVDADGNVAGAWDDGDPGVPRQATAIQAKYMNAVQEELAGTVEAAGLTLDAANNGQLLKALLKLTLVPLSHWQVDTSFSNFAAMQVGVPTFGFFESAAGALYAFGGDVVDGGMLSVSYDGGAYWSNAVVDGTPTAETFNAMAEHSGVLVLVGDDVAGANYIATSADQAVTWSARTSALAAQNLNDVKWLSFASLFLITGAGGGLETSPTGTTWTSRTNALGAVDTGHIAVGTSVAVIHRRSANATNQLAWSTNGTSWTAVTLPGSSASTRVTTVSWMPTPALFVATVVNAASEVYVYSSPDGATWTQRTKIASNIASVPTYYPQRICVGTLAAAVLSVDLAQALPLGDKGYFRRFWTSTDGITWEAGPDFSVPNITLTDAYSRSFYYSTAKRRMFVSPAQEVLYRTQPGGLL